MLILFDHGTPKGLIRALSGHMVFTAQARGWDQLSNGALLSAAEEAAFDLLLTTDRRIRYQQNLAGRKVALVHPISRNRMPIGEAPPLAVLPLSRFSPSRFSRINNQYRICLVWKDDGAHEVEIVDYHS